MRDDMKIRRVPSYRFRITGEANKTVWSGTFTEYPKNKDVEAAMWLDIEALESSDTEHHLEEASDYRQLLEVVRHYAPTCRTYYGEQKEVIVAGVVLGEVTIGHEAIFSPVEEFLRCFTIRRGGQAFERILTDEERRNLKKEFTIQGAQDNA